MSDRADRKLETVVLATFHYRHEAEFAAGFLDEAKIPYRMQVDDAAMGMTFTTPARIWVRGMDLARARAVLDHSDHGLEEHEEAEHVPGAADAHDELDEWIEAEHADDGRAAGSAAASTAGSAVGEEVSARARTDRGATHPVADRQARVVRRETNGAVDATRLTLLERLLSAGLFVGAVGFAGLVTGEPNGVVWAIVLVILALPLAAGALLGRTLATVRGVLRAISGSAP